MTWSPQSWRQCEARQQPAYPDPGALAAAERELAAYAPLVPIAEVHALRAALAEAQAGRAFLLQGGDCAESFAEFSPANIDANRRLARRDGSADRRRVRPASDPGRPDGRPVRQAALGSGGGARGRRLALPIAATSSTASPSTPPRAAPIPSGCSAPTPSPRRRSARLRGRGRSSPATKRFCSPYEAAARPPRRGSPAAIRQLRPFPLDRRPHPLPRLGPCRARPRPGQSDRDQMRPSLDADMLLPPARPFSIPVREPGRITLIARMGHDRVETCLPPLLRAVAAEGHPVLWSCDPMHGNTVASAEGKTRPLADILAEARAFFAVARAEGVRGGGLHFEMTGRDVAECTGGAPITERTSPRATTAIATRASIRPRPCSWPSSSRANWPVSRPPRSGLFLPRPGSVTPARSL